MKKYLFLLPVPFCLLASQAASADSMMCGTHMIQDDQNPGLSRSEVEAKCGTPQNVSGDTLFYVNGNVTYRLDFNDADELESITAEVE